MSVQGVVLIALLAAIGASAWRGLENIQDGANRWTRISLGLIAVTLLVAALSVQAVPAGWRVGLTGKFFAVVLSVSALYALARHRLPEHAIRDWLWESWRFLKQIFPLLVIGVFVVGMLRVLIRHEWIEMLAGSNSRNGFGLLHRFCFTLAVNPERGGRPLSAAPGAGRADR